LTLIDDESPPRACRRNGVSGVIPTNTMSESTFNIISLVVIFIVVAFGLLYFGWSKTKGLSNHRIKILLRSGLVGSIIAPSMLAAGHAALPIPALLAIFIYLSEGMWLWAIVWGLLPMLLISIPIFLIWLAFFEIRRLISTHKSEHNKQNN
jgi:hypothetical protein